MKCDGYFGKENINLALTQKIRRKMPLQKLKTERQNANITQGIRY